MKKTGVYFMVCSKHQKVKQLESLKHYTSRISLDENALIISKGPMVTAPIVGLYVWYLTLYSQNVDLFKAAL